uniref:Uncharacterized protein n=1 Tax=Oryza meridionalis TaxID=40149 RepID=A0A0E0DXP7_9ORYZ
MYQGERSNSNKNKSNNSQKPSGSKQDSSRSQTIVVPSKTPHCPFCEVDGYWQGNCSCFKVWLAKKGIQYRQEGSKRGAKPNRVVDKLAKEAIMPRSVHPVYTCQNRISLTLTEKALQAL